MHVQLTMQVRHLIGTGALKPGMQLPTVRQLAGFLRINRNTVARALANLHRDGYLQCQQGRGTFVVERPPTREGRAARSLDRLVAETLDRARRLGFTHDEILATVAAHAPAGTRSDKPKKARALLVECNREELARYRDDLETELPLSVDPLLVDELRERAAREPDMFKGYRLVITTFFHIHEVKHVVPADGPPDGGAALGGEPRGPAPPHRAARGRRGRADLQHGLAAARTCSAPCRRPASAT